MRIITAQLGWLVFLSVVLLVLLLLPEFGGTAEAWMSSQDEEMDGDEDRDQDSGGEETGEVLVKPDPDLLLEIRRSILYGPDRENGETEAAASPEFPAEYSTGRIHVKMKAGMRIEKTHGLTSLYDESGENAESEALYYLDYEFPDAEIKPLWGDAAKLTNRNGATHPFGARKRLVSEGYDIPECGDTDTDTTIQVLLAARRLTK